MATEYEITVLSTYTRFVRNEADPLCLLLHSDSLQINKLDVNLGSNLPYHVRCNLLLVGSFDTNLSKRVSVQHRSEMRSTCQCLFFALVHCFFSGQYFVRTTSRLKVVTVLTSKRNSSCDSSLVCSDVYRTMVQTRLLNNTKKTPFQQSTVNDRRLTRESVNPLLQQLVHAHLVTHSSLNGCLPVVFASLVPVCTLSVQLLLFLHYVTPRGTVIEAKWDSCLSTNDLVVPLFSEHADLRFSDIVLLTVNNSCNNIWNTVFLRHDLAQTIDTRESCQVESELFEQLPHRLGNTIISFPRCCLFSPLCKLPHIYLQQYVDVCDV